MMIHCHLPHHLWSREGQQMLFSSLKRKHSVKDRGLDQSPASFLPQPFNYLQPKRLVSPALPPAGKGILHFTAACFFNLCSSALECILQGTERWREGSPRQGPPSERTGSGTWSWRKRRQSSSGSPESCWAKSSWPPGSRSSRPPAGARAPAKRDERSREESAGGALRREALWETRGKVASSLLSSCNTLPFVMWLCYWTSSYWTNLQSYVSSLWHQVLATVFLMHLCIQMHITDIVTVSMLAQIKPHRATSMAVDS